ncbi:MAG: hypothetical protein K6A44_03670 [bacterium]|nr:hypothetical protein [bacterium]
MSRISKVQFPRGNSKDISITDSAENSKPKENEEKFNQEDDFSSKPAEA